MFNSIFKKKKSAKEILATGEFNWRLNPHIYSLDGFPNYASFLRYIEDRDKLQFGLRNDNYEERTRICVVQHAIYNMNNSPVLWFNIDFMFIEFANKIAFSAFVADFWKPETLPTKEMLAIISTNKSEDLTIEEYEKYYDELYSQSLAIQGLDKSNYKRFRDNGMDCILKLMETKCRADNK